MLENTMNISVSTLRGPEDPKATSPQQKQNTTRSAFILPNAKAEPQHLAPAPNLPGRFYTASSSHLCKLPRTEQNAASKREFFLFSPGFSLLAPTICPVPKSRSRPNLVSYDFPFSNPFCVLWGWLSQNFPSIFEE